MSEGLPGFVSIPGGAEAPALNNDGRNIDLGTGALLGEGAGQKALAARQDVDLQSQVFPHVPSRQLGEPPTYYGTPVLKQPVWIWSIAMYFYVGGVAGMSATLGSAAQ